MRDVHHNDEQNVAMFKNVGAWEDCMIAELDHEIYEAASYNSIYWQGFHLSCVRLLPAIKLGINQSSGEYNDTLSH